MNALVLEGSPHRIMAGWVNFQIIIRHNGGLKVSTCLSQAGRGEIIARELRGKFFAAGTWENAGREVGTLRTLELKTEVMLEPRFPAPRPEILDELFKAGGAK